MKFGQVSQKMTDWLNCCELINNIILCLFQLFIFHSWNPAYVGISLDRMMLSCSIFMFEYFHDILITLNLLLSLLINQADIYIVNMNFYNYFVYPIISSRAAYTDSQLHIHKMIHASTFFRQRMPTIDPLFSLIYWLYISYEWIFNETVIKI